MKFEQAFYTRGMHQLSRYKQGLGICAASNLSMEFMDKCLRVGAPLNTEHTVRTAQFVFFDETFEAFVGVGISPPLNNDGGVVNKLCHLIIPENTAANCEPEEYYLVYPFDRAVEEGALLEKIEISPVLSLSDYEKVRNRYFENSDKLAEFLYCLFPCVMGEENRLIIVLDNEKHEEDAYSVVARELTWLASYLMIGSGEELRRFRRNLSYGVYTTENTSLVRLIYTDTDTLGNRCFYLDRPVETEVPEIYKLMAKKAFVSLNEFKNWTDELLKLRQGRNLRSEHLLMMYIRWKLQNKIRVDEAELPVAVNMLTYQAQDSEWSRRFLLEYVSQMSNMDNRMMINVWERNIAPEMQRYEELMPEDQTRLIDATECLVGMMFTKNKKNYNLLLKKLPEKQGAEVQKKLLLQENSPVREDIEAIDINDINGRNSFCSVVDRYKLLWQDEDFQRLFLKQLEGKALVLYFAENMDSLGREELSERMKALDDVDWENCIADRIKADYFEGTDLKELLDKDLKSLSKEYIIPEKTLLDKYYACLYERLQGQNTADNNYPGVLKWASIIDKENSYYEKFKQKLYDLSKNKLEYRMRWQLAYEKPEEAKFWNDILWEQFEEIYNIVSKDEELRNYIENEELVENCSRTGQFTRKYYAVWECVHTGSYNLMADIPGYDDAPAEGKNPCRWISRKKEIRRFLGWIKEILFNQENVTENHIITWLAAERKLDELKKVQPDLSNWCDKFRNLQKEQKHFAEKVRTLEPQRDKKPESQREIFDQLLKQMRSFYRVCQWQEKDTIKDDLERAHTDLKESRELSLTEVKETKKFEVKFSDAMMAYLITIADPDEFTEALEKYSILSEDKCYIPLLKEKGTIFYLQEGIEQKIKTKLREKIRPLDENGWDQVMRSELKKRLENQPLEKLAEISVDGLSEKLGLEEDEVKTHWKECVYNSLNQKDAVEKKLYEKLLESLQKYGSDKEHRDLMLNKAGEDFEKLLLWHFYFHDFQEEEYRFWDGIKFSQFDEINRIFKERPDLKKFVETKTKIGKTYGEFNKICFKIWKNVYEDRFDNLNTLTKYPSSKEGKEFLDSLEGCIWKKGSALTTNVVATYLAIQYKSEDVVPSGWENIKKRCEKYKRLRKDHPEFAGFVKTSQEEPSEERIRECWKEMKYFYKACDWNEQPISASNRREAAGDLRECLKIFNTTIHEIKNFKNNFKNAMEGLKKEYEEKVNDIKERSERIVPESRSIKSKAESIENQLKSCENKINSLKKQLAIYEKAKEELSNQKQELENIEKESRENEELASEYYTLREEAGPSAGIPFLSDQPAGYPKKPFIKKTIEEEDYQPEAVSIKPNERPAGWKMDTGGEIPQGAAGLSARNRGNYKKQKQ